MNRALLRLSIACLAMFVLLLINVNYVQAFKSSSLASKPGNIRIFNQQFQYQRGSILATGDGGDTKIAESRLTKRRGIYQRVLPRRRGRTRRSPATTPSTAPPASRRRRTRNCPAPTPRLEVHNLISLITGKPKHGRDASRSRSARGPAGRLQGARPDGGRSGAVVAIDPRTGAILAMASYPTFNPNQYATLNGTKLNQVDAANRANPNQPLLNRAIQATYPPGSTFKIITSSAAFSTGRVAGTNATVPGPDRACRWATATS